MEILKDIPFVQAVITVLLLYVAWTFRTALAEFKSSIKDLYEKYGHHDTRLTRVETVHDVKGCDSKKGWYQLDRHAPPRQRNGICGRRGVSVHHAAAHICHNQIQILFGCELRRGCFYQINGPAKTSIMETLGGN